MTWVKKHLPNWINCQNKLFDFIIFKTFHSIFNGQLLFFPLVSKESYFPVTTKLTRRSLVLDFPNYSFALFPVSIIIISVPLFGGKWGIHTTTGAWSKYILKFGAYLKRIQFNTFLSDFYCILSHPIYCQVSSGFSHFFFSDESNRMLRMQVNICCSLLGLHIVLVDFTGKKLFKMFHFERFICVSNKLSISSVPRGYAVNNAWINRHHEKSMTSQYIVSERFTTNSTNARIFGGDKTVLNSISKQHSVQWYACFW